MLCPVCPKTLTFMWMTSDIIQFYRCKGCCFVLYDIKAKKIIESIRSGEYGRYNSKKR